MTIAHLRQRLLHPLTETLALGLLGVDGLRYRADQAPNQAEQSGRNRCTIWLRLSCDKEPPTPA